MIKLFATFVVHGGQRHINTALDSGSTVPIDCLFGGGRMNCSVGKSFEGGTILSRIYFGISDLCHK